MADANETYDLMKELDLLDPKQVTAYVDDFDEVQLQVGDGEPQGPVTARRIFPLTWTDEFIALSTPDGEIGIVRRLKELDRDSRRVLETELEWRHFSTQITAIHSIDVRHYVPHWDVETARGRRVFEMRSRRDLRVLGGSRVLLKDADGNRYDIPDINQLDAPSRQLIDAQL